MTNEKREICRIILEFLTPDVANAGFKKFKSFKFSFENLTRVERDDRIRAENKKAIVRIAEKTKLSRNHVYRIRKRK